MYLEMSHRFLETNFTHLEIEYIYLETNHTLDLETHAKMASGECFIFRTGWQPLCYAAYAMKSGCSHNPVVIIFVSLILTLVASDIYDEIQLKYLWHRGDYCQMHC